MKRTQKQQEVMCRSDVFSTVLTADSFFCFVSWQFDGVFVVSGSLDTSIRVWDAETGAHSRFLLFAHRQRWGREADSGCSVAAGGCVHTLTGHQSLTSGMELRNNILVSGNADSTVRVWDVRTGHCLHTLQGMWRDTGQILTMIPLRHRYLSKLRSDVPTDSKTSTYCLLEIHGSVLDNRMLLKCLLSSASSFSSMSK